MSALTVEKSSTPEPTVFSSAPRTVSVSDFLSIAAESVQTPSESVFLSASNVHLP